MNKNFSSERNTKNIDVYNQENIPKLRFPEFNGEWINYFYSQLSEFISSGKSHSKEIEDGIYNYYGSVGLIGHCNNYTYNDTLLIIARVGANTGDVYLIEKQPCNISDNTIIIKHKEKLVNYIFSLNYLKTYNFKRIIIGSGRPLITSKDVKKIEIKLPCIEEQEKIASFLSAIDKKIDLMEKKHIQYKKLKKYLLQNLLPSTNKTIPNIRFKEFTDKLKYTKLKNMLEYSTSNLSLNQLENNTGIYILYGADGVAKYIDFYELDQTYISIVKDGAGVGRLNLCSKYSSIVGTMAYLTVKYIEKYSLIYIYYLLNTINFDKYIIGSTIPHIYFKEYSKETVFIPSLNEQNKIASVLSCIDKRINLTSDKINLLKQFKSGLLQKMFY